MKVEMVDIGLVKPYENNPRNNADAVDAVAKSISEFGFRNPILVDSEMVIIAGHTRLLAARKLGLEKVPVIKAKDLSPEKVKALRIADNKTGEIASWNEDLLRIELRNLQVVDFDLSLLGFGEDELSLLLEEDVVTPGETDPNAVGDLPEIPKSKEGEIYQLGPHRLYCGDCQSQQAIDALMDGEKADLWLTDPPYNVDYEGQPGLTIANDKMSDDSFRKFLVDSFKIAVNVLREGASYYIFHADSEGFNFRGACRDVGLQVRQCLIWKKNTMVLGRQDYQWKHEPCLYGWKGGAGHHWYSDRSQTTILEFNKPARSDQHPTMKPVEMLVYLIKNSSRPGAIVFDDFGGSGSTLIACEQTGRVCRISELMPKYCDVIRQRWAEFKKGEGCDWEAETPPVSTVRSEDGRRSNADRPDSCDVGEDPRPLREPNDIDADA